MNEAFARFARSVADQCGRAYTFIIVLAAILIWLASGPLFGFSDTWQLVINTITTLITTLMVFVVQHTQVRDTIAMHAKLDALIRVSEAPNRMQAIEELTEDQLRAVRERERR